MLWKKLQPDEVFFLGQHSAAICFEAVCADETGDYGHDWVVLACAIFQTVAYFCDGTIYFKDWEMIAGLPRGSQHSLVNLMRCRGWRTQSAAVPAPWRVFS